MVRFPDTGFLEVRTDVESPGYLRLFARLGGVTAWDLLLIPT